MTARQWEISEEEAGLGRLIDTVEAATPEEALREAAGRRDWDPPAGWPVFDQHYGEGDDETYELWTGGEDDVRLVVRATS